MNRPSTVMNPPEPSASPGPASRTVAVTLLPEEIHEKHTGTGAAGGSIEDTAAPLKRTGVADGFLFVEDDLIRSVLDLTRELQALGIIEIYRQPSGADYYRIVKKTLPRGVPKQLKAELADRIAAIFRRRRTTLWSAEEIKAYRALVIDPNDLAVIEQYYASEAGKEKSYCRTTLLTFLRHYPGEVDRARRWKETSGRRHCY